jgi:hypothetical protein
MPKVSDVYSGAGLKADDDVPDLEDGGLIVTIKDAEIKDFDNGTKIILKFKETDKDLILNKTNADTLTKMFESDDTDDWNGRKIKLYATDVSYQGKAMRGIRVYSKPVKKEPAVKHSTDFDETAPPPRRPADDDFEV